MSGDSTTRREEALDRFWDDLTSYGLSAPVHFDPDLEPMLAEAIRRLHVLDSAPGEDPAFGSRLWEELMDDHATTGTIPLRHHRPFPTNGHAIPAEWRRPGPGEPVRRRSRAVLAPLAAALLIAVLLVGMYRVNLDGPAHRGAAPPGSPIPAPTAAASAGYAAATLIDEMFPADWLPADDTEVTFYRVSLDPGVALPYLAGPYCGCGGEMVAPGVGVELVVAGSYAVRLDRPFVVRRAGAGAEEEIAAETVVTLEPGDVAVYPDYAAGGELRNSGTEPLLLLGVAITSKEVPDGTPVGVLPAGALAERIAKSSSVDWETLPSGPKAVLLRRVTVGAGERIGPYDPDGLEALHVETGAVAWSIVRAGEATPSGGGTTIHAGGTFPFIVLGAGSRLAFDNGGDEPATVLVLTIRPADGAPGTPVP